MADSTVIIGSLNDKELKESINALVNHVEQSTQKMAKSFDATIDNMKKKLQELGIAKVDMGGGTDGGSTRRTSAVQKETQARKELVATLDQQAKAMQEATAPKSARESYLAFQRGFKEQANQIAQQIREAEAALKQSVDNRISELNQKLTTAKQKLSELNVELAKQRMNAEKTGNYSTYNAGISRTKQAIEYTKRHIQELNQEIAKAPSLFNAQAQHIEELRAKHERVANIMKEETTSQQQVTQATQQQAQAQQQVTQALQKQQDQVKMIADTVRASKDWNTHGSYLYPTERGNYLLSAKSNLTLEEQILVILEKQKMEVSQMTQSMREEETVAKQILESEKLITQEQAKRKKYKEPSTWQGIEVTRDKISSIISSKIRGDAYSWDEQTSSIKRLSAALKQYQEAYIKMSVTERNSPFGKQMITDMQVLERNIQKLRSEMSRPVSWEAVKNLPTKTLDDIAYKMQKLSAFRSGLDIDRQRKEINQVNAEYDRLKKKMDEVMQKNQQLFASNQALGRSWNYMKNRLAFYFTVGASTAFVKNLIEVRSQYEMNERALGILINSAERGTQIFNELSQMALVSPYTLIELSSAAKQLTAYDVAAKDVVDTTRRLADMASAVGVPIERLTYALGQIKAYGYLNSRDNRMFANAGIPLVKQLADYYTELEGKLVSTADVYDRIKKKAVGYNDVMQVINKMTDEGGKFFDFQAKMADTLKVQLANLTLAWNNMLNDIGQSQQGILSSGISTLKTLFLNWRNIEKALLNVAIAYGLVKIAQIALVKMGKVQMMPYLSSTATQMGKLTNITNAFKKSLVSILNTPTTWWFAVAAAIVGIGMTFYNAYQNVKKFNDSIREGAEENLKNISEYTKSIQGLRDSLYEVQKNSEGNVVTDNQGKTVSKAVDIEKGEAKKAWESMREQIELSSAASETYIQNLNRIENISSRLRQGFSILGELQEVNAALKEVNSTTIGLPQDMSSWWNIFMLPDGLITNIKDYTNALNNEVEVFGTTVKRWTDQTELNIKIAKNILDTNIKDFTNSVNRFINAQGLSDSPIKIEEAYSQIVKKITTENQLNPQQAFALQQGVEAAKSAAMREALQSRLEDERRALAAERDENAKADIQSRIESLEEQKRIYAKNLDESRPYWNDFTKYLKERHISEIQGMFRDMNAEQIRSLNFQEGKYNDFVKRTVEGYAKSHKLSYDEAFNYLKHWVLNANTWSIFIPLTISTGEGKSIIETLNEADSMADSAYGNIKRLKEYEKELVKAGAESTIHKLHNRLVETRQEIADAEKDYEKQTSLQRGGKSKKESQDEKRSAADAKKRAKEAAKAQREAETELQKALKDELQLIDKVRSQYKKLSDAGVESTTALAMVTNQFNNSIAHINEILGKNGLPLFNIKTFAGTDNPNKILEMLKAQLEAAKHAQNIKPEEIKELEIKYGEIVIDAKVYNTKKISEGLNNELGKLKEEYELAVELDANPELGDMFVEMMGLDKKQIDQIPRTYYDVAKKAQASIDKVLKDNNVLSAFNLEDNLQKDSLKKWAEANGHELKDGLMTELSKYVEWVNKVRLDESKKQIKAWQELLKKYSEFEYKRKQVAETAMKERVDLVNKLGSQSQKSYVAKIMTKLDATDNPSEKERLKGELESIISDLTESNEQAARIAVSISRKESEETAKINFEEFKNGDDWIAAMGDSANLTSETIRRLIKELQDLIATNSDLDATQIKEINGSIEKMRNTLIERNPFSALSGSIDTVKQKTQELKKARKELEGAEISEQLAKISGNFYKLGKAQENVRKKINKVKQKERELSDAQSDLGKNISDAINQVREFYNIMTNLQSALGETANQAIQAGLGMAIAMNTAFEAIKNGERSVAILAIIEAALTAINFVAGLFGGKKDTFTPLKEQLETLTDVMGKVAQAQLEALGKMTGSRAVKKYMELKKNNDLIVQSYRDLAYAAGESGSSVGSHSYAYRTNRDLANSWEKISQLAGTTVTKIQDLYNLTPEQLKAIMEGAPVEWAKMSSEIREALEGIIEYGIDKTKEYTEALAEALTNITLDDLTNDFESMLQDMDSSAETFAEDFEEYMRNAIIRSMMVGTYANELETWYKHFQERIKDDELSESDVERLREEYMDIVNRALAERDRLLDVVGSSVQDGDLSALQQGIQGITEDTASALEAYMNSVSQQVYYHSSLLEQIRDAVSAYDADIQLATQAEMLLQLQQSYQVQMSIQGILEGVLTPSGQAFQVELL